MNALKLLLVCTSLALLFIVGPSLAPTASCPATADWQTTLQQRLPVYGHRNWIIVSDPAFPAYSQNGIEMIVANQDLASALNYVAQAISSSKHVRATAFLDQELQFVQEKGLPGSHAFAAGNLHCICQEQLVEYPSLRSFIQN